MKDQNISVGGSEQRMHGSITFSQLVELCDDVKRDEPGGADVRALLRFEPESGFALLALDGRTVYQVVDDKWNQVRFRTVEDALMRLNDVHGLSPDIGLFLAGRAIG